MSIYSDFKIAYHNHDARFRDWSKPVHSQFWQATDVSQRPEAEMRELLMLAFDVPLRGIEDLNHWRQEIQPNLPWADDHFVLERVSGEPINPGTTWMDWPYGHSAANFRDAHGQFSHSYAERYWPKHAGHTPGGQLRDYTYYTNNGIRFQLGDLGDLVALMVKDPLTRQAYLPVFFPEDTGGAGGERVPCTLGYWFLRRGDKLHVYYPIRSCDFIRHYCDDVYLTVRLLLWILTELRVRDPKKWMSVKPGMFSMWIGSFHMFINDWNHRYGKPPVTRISSDPDGEAGR